MQNDKIPAQALLAVFPDRETAQQVADRLARGGVDRSRLRLDAARDEVTSLEAEVLEESHHSSSSPTVGVAYPKETVKAGAVFLPPAIVIGAVLGAVAALPLGGEGWPLWLRALVGAVVGATMGGTIAAVVIPAMSVKNPHDPSAAETGVTLRVGDARPATIEALVAARPLRLDRLGEGDVPLGTVATEEDLHGGGIVEEVADNFARERRAEPHERTR
ncbi:hypothetical protein HC251_05010 [Iamia sp. SCSIO 61187]|uniref:hypothetical protein n=1 Tax=Iamia sp. SCSIO 61187 TaxID=2722752 RepID=UPI001C63B20F|nr:hypothetical protein [Iamia sp. SCSIO 61187]QYG91859.1 hypothetical protein HC251_05010 [Iamia sp. SCSIO 61187]